MDLAKLGELVEFLDAAGASALAGSQVRLVSMHQQVHRPFCQSMRGRLG